MSVAISGMGWVTPLGTDLDAVWERLMSGETGRTGEILGGPAGRSFRGFQVDPKWVQNLGRQPRLRRSSAISYFTAAAGLAALGNAGLSSGSPETGRVALVFAVSSGGVAYTRRFYEKIAVEGAGAASPLLFPETVYNAPASHLASVLGIDGVTYTLVGDASVGIAALKQAEQLLEADQADHCLVIGGEELDWILCEAYRQWRLLAKEPTVSVYKRRPAGMILAEGAAAIVISRAGRIQLDSIDEGEPFFKRSEAAPAIGKVLSRIANGGAPDVIIASANGTFIDRAERDALERIAPDASIYTPKVALGEALGASALIQTILAALVLERNELPGVPTDSDFAHLNRQALRGINPRHCLVSVLGLNQQAAGAILSRAADGESH